MLEKGALLGGKYRIEARIASGGQAHVYRAEQLGLGRRVAVKVLRVEGSGSDSNLVKRFEREARLLSTLRDPHTITLFDYGQLDGGGLYMVFEFIDGSSLKEVIQSEGRMAPNRVAKIMHQMLLSLQEAHAFGVLHRDIKPQNVMLYAHAGRQDQVKLIDFGIAKIFDDEYGDPDLTATDHVVGTPRYIAPELIFGHAPSPASDLYSVGLIGYELLTGHNAVVGRTPMEVVRQQVDPTSITLPPGLSTPDGLRSIVNALMEKLPDRRYQSAEAVLGDLPRWHEHVAVARPDAAPEQIDLDPFTSSGHDLQHEARTAVLSANDLQAMRQAVQPEPAPAPRAPRERPPQHTPSGGHMVVRPAASSPAPEPSGQHEAATGVLSADRLNELFGESGEPGPSGAPTVEVSAEAATGMISAERLNELFGEPSAQPARRREEQLQPSAPAPAPAPLRLGEDEDEDEDEEVQATAILSSDALPPLHRGTPSRAPLADEDEDEDAQATAILSGDALLWSHAPLAAPFDAAPFDAASEADAQEGAPTINDGHTVILSADQLGAYGSPFAEDPSPAATAPTRAARQQPPTPASLAEGSAPERRDEDATEILSNLDTSQYAGLFDDADDEQPAAEQPVAEAASEEDPDATPSRGIPRSYSAGGDARRGGAPRASLLRRPRVIRRNRDPED